MTDPTHRRSDRLRYDPEFESAVRAGWLSVEEAARRGNRAAHAAALMERYGLGLEQALRVTDNRVRLFEVMRQTGRVADAPRQPTGMGRVGRLQISATCIGLIALTVLFGTHQWQTQMKLGRRLEQAAFARVEAPGARSVGSVRSVRSDPGPTPEARLERNETGGIRRITGNTPTAALSVWCRDVVFGQCAWSEVIPSDPPFPGQRLGLYVSALDDESQQVVTIRRDRRSGRWLIRPGSRVGPSASPSASPSLELGAKVEAKAGADAGVAQACTANDGTDCL